MVRDCEAGPQGWNTYWCMNARGALTTASFSTVVRCTLAENTAQIRQTTKTTCTVSILFQAPERCATLESGLKEQSNTTTQPHVPKHRGR